jgi:hypothetical protein
MSEPCYSVHTHPVSTILSWVRAEEIAIPEIQRPFVWKPAQVRNLLDSLYRGYPVGYLISWKNPDVRLKNGRTSEGKKILIDGQQRVTALMAALLGHEVLRDDYSRQRIKIAFHPIREQFEVTGSVLEKDPAWISDVSMLFADGAMVSKFCRQYLAANPALQSNDESADQAETAINKVMRMAGNQVGIIELAAALDIDTVTEIFIRINSEGQKLNEADFAMSKLAANTRYGGNSIRKAIDYFCHLAEVPDSHKHIEANDREFAKSDWWPSIRWLKDANDDIYDPNYTDVLRVAFMTQFSRGRMRDLVALLGGRDFETRTNREEIASDSFSKLEAGVRLYVRQTYFERFVMILRSAGFVEKTLIAANNPIDFAYTIYLRGKMAKVPESTLQQIVAQWYVMSLLTGRYSGQPETPFDRDIQRIDKQGVVNYVREEIARELSDDFWTSVLPNNLDTTSSKSPYYLVFLAAQVKLETRAFLSRTIKVSDLLMQRGDHHHIFPKDVLKKQGIEKSQQNQVGNFVFAETTINLAIGAKHPSDYFGLLVEQCGKAKEPAIGSITSKSELTANLAAHAIPSWVLSASKKEFDYETFLGERRRQMAMLMKSYFALL